MNLEYPESFQNEILDEVESIIGSKSEMVYSERQFLNGVIRQLSPRKVVEIGVAAGSSATIILNAIKDIEDAHLYSLDYSTQYYTDKSKKTGFMVDKFPELAKKWTLRTGGMACNFLDEIGKDIDVCFIDTSHCNPGEFLDYLQVLPYMKKNGVIILHDISLHTIWLSHLNTCCTLFSAIKGKKVIPERPDREFFANIGAIILDSDAIDNVFDVFNCLVQPWTYRLSTADIEQLTVHFQRFYSKKMVNLFLTALKYAEKILSENETRFAQSMAFRDYFIKVKAQKQINKLAKIYKNKKVVIYGAGIFATELFKQCDLSRLNIVALADQKFEFDKHDNPTIYPAIGPSELKDFDCDAILFALQNSQSVLEYVEDNILLDTKNEHLQLAPILANENSEYFRKFMLTLKTLKR